MGYEWDGKYYWYCGYTNEIVSRERNVRFTPRTLCEFLNFKEENRDGGVDIVTELYLENEWRKDYQRTLENKIRRLKKRIQVLEK